MGSTGSDNDGEWMVSYHGTNKNAMANIVETGFQERFGRRFAFGKGI